MPVSSPNRRDGAVSAYQSTLKTTLKLNSERTAVQKDKLNSYLFDKCLPDEYHGNYDFSTSAPSEKDVDWAKYNTFRVKESYASCYINGKYYPGRVISYHDIDPFVFKPVQRHPNSIMNDELEQLAASGIDVYNAKQGSEDLRRLQKVGEEIAKRVNSLMEEMAIPGGSADISVDLENDRISVKLPAESEGLTDSLGKAINNDPELKELLTFTASGMKMAEGKADEVVYDDFNAYIKENFGQDISELKWENGKITGANYLLETALKCGDEPGDFQKFCNANNIPGFWREKDTGLITAVEYNQKPGSTQARGIAAVLNATMGRETSQGFMATLSVLAKNGPPKSSGPVEFKLENGDLKSANNDYPLSKSQMTEDKKGDFDFFAQYSGAHIYRGGKYYEKIYSQMK